ncbi:31432_t:CDS:2, partial [Racocetra persica]
YKVEWTENGVIEVEDDEPSKNILERPTISFFNEGDESLPPLPPADDFISRLQFLQAPYDIPPIYQGVRLIVYCILAKGVEPRKSITLSAMSQDGPMRLEIPIDPVTLQGTKIHTLAARKLIQNLEDGTSFLHKHQKYRGKQVPNSIVRNQIVALGKTYNLASRYTSFIAIDERDVDMTKEQDVDMTKEQGYKPLQMVVPNYTPPNYQKVGFGSNQSNFPVFSQQNSQTIGFGQIPCHMSFNSLIAKPVFGAASYLSGKREQMSNQPNLSQFGGFAVPTSTQPQAFNTSSSNIPFGGFNNRSGGFTATLATGPPLFRQNRLNSGGFGSATQTATTQTASQSLFGQNTSNSGGFGFGSVAQSATQTVSQPLFGQNTSNSDNGRFGFGSVTQSATQTVSQPLFGQNTLNSDNGGFGFGSATQTASQPLFGQNTSNSNYGGFGSATQTASQSLFGQNTLKSNNGGFGFGSATQTASQPLFRLNMSNSDNGGFGFESATQTAIQPLFGQNASNNGQSLFESITSNDGGFGAAFGLTTQTVSQPTFGTAFGSATQTSSQPTFGTAFGSATQTSSQPTF